VTRIHRLPGRTSKVDSPEQREKRRLREALWTIYLAGHDVSPQRLPGALHPIPLQDAVEVVSRYEDDRSVGRAIVVLRQLFNAAGGSFTGFINRASEASAAAEQADFDEAAGNLAKPLGVDPELLKILMKRILLPTPLGLKCLYGECVGRNAGSPDSTLLVSTIEMDEELDDEKVAFLDPRRWPDSSDLFLEMVPVIDEQGTYKEKELKDANGNDLKHGDPFNDELFYELAEVGPQRVENILKISQTKHRSSNRLDEFCLNYRLYNNLSYSIGPFEFAGIMRQNSGKFVAKRNISVANRSAGAARSGIVITKTVSYGPLTPMNAWAGIRFADVFNCIAPVALCLWVHDLARIVPCGDKAPASTG